MNTEIISHVWTEALGWALVHFVWQGALVALFYGAVRLFSDSPKTRYAAGCAALSILAILPLITFWAIADGRLSNEREIERAAAPAFAGNAPANHTAARFSIDASASADRFGTRTILRRWLESRITLCVPLWAAGVAFMAVRLGLGAWRVRRFCAQHDGELEAPWISKLEELQTKLGVTRRVRLVKSTLVEVPTVIGWLRPVILFPLSSIVGLSPAQMSAILAHELAHIRRHDYLVNLFQVALETVLFYHPAVWWISKQVRADRELCCDDLAVTLCERAVYVRALISIEELRAVPSALVLAADGGSLSERVRRLLGATAGDHGSKWRRPVAMALMGLALVGAVGMAASGFLAPKYYESTARVLLHPDHDHGPADLDSNAPGLEDPYWIQAEAERIASRSVIYRALEQRSGKRHQGSSRYASMQKAEAYDLLRSRLAVNQVKNTRLLNITLLGEDPYETAVLVNAILEAYREMRESRFQSEYDRRSRVLAEEADEMESKYVNALEALESLREQQGTNGAASIRFDVARRKAEQLKQQLDNISATSHRTRLDFQTRPFHALEIVDQAEPGTSPTRRRF
jgi:beta-lactamase regulating signal transducer with metallopeptidase domain